VELTPKEFDLLAVLASSPRQVFTRSQLLANVWHSTSDWQDDATVPEHIYRLRRKLDDTERTRWIQTVRGIGYRFVVAAPSSEASEG
jgi:DNA-binding response OmpR family regulator